MHSSVEQGPDTASAGEPDASRCPLCGQANACVPAACGSFDPPCWCAGVTVNATALARIPASAQQKACLCRACATAQAAGS